MCGLCVPACPKKPYALGLSVCTGKEGDKNVALPLMKGQDDSCRGASSL